jgi:murein DD-endopeptidase MepM/ murein hydrolase activator NlpD
MARPKIRAIGAIATAIGGVAATLLIGPTSATAAYSVAGTVSVGKGEVALRAGASLAAAKVGALRNKAKISIVCQVTGDLVKGKVRKTNKWDLLTNGQYVTDAFVKRNTRTKISVCPPPATITQTGDPMAVAELDGVRPGSWVIPVPKVAIGGFRTVERPQHDGVDLGHVRNTPIHTIADGTVVTVRCNASTPTCDVDGSPSTTGCGWYVEVRHVNDVVSRYCHMVRQPSVVVGDKVLAGQVIGYVGTSGHSSGPHLHFEVHLDGDRNASGAVDPAAFMREQGAALGMGT